LISRWLRNRGLARIPADTHAACAACAAADAPASEAAQSISSIVDRIDAASAPTGLLLRAVVELLQRVDPDATKMTAENLGVVFGPTLIYRENPEELMTHVKVRRTQHSRLGQTDEMDDHVLGRHEAAPAEHLPTPKAFFSLPCSCSMCNINMTLCIHHVSVHARRATRSLWS
jgi:hypothetical protein